MGIIRPKRRLDQVTFGEILAAAMADALPFYMPEVEDLDLSPTQRILAGITAARQFSLPMHLKHVQLLNPQTSNAAITTDVISLKSAHKAWIVWEYTQAVGHATTPTLRQATTVAAGTTAAGPTSRIWANEDTAATDTLVAQTAAALYAVTNDVKNKTVVFEVDPATLTNATATVAAYDCVYMTQGTSGQATNFCSCTAWLLERYAQATPPSAILD